EVRRISFTAAQRLGITSVEPGMSQGNSRELGLHPAKTHHSRCDLPSADRIDQVLRVAVSCPGRFVRATGLLFHRISVDLPSVPLTGVNGSCKEATLPGGPATWK